MSSKLDRLRLRAAHFMHSIGSIRAIHSIRSVVECHPPLLPSLLIIALACSMAAAVAAASTLVAGPFDQSQPDPVDLRPALVLSPDENIPAPQPVQTVEATAPTIPPIYTTYVVEAGDTLTAISTSSGVTVGHLAWNNAEVIPNADIIHPGQELRIPGINGLIYTVQAGDTLFGLAERHGVESLVISSYQANQIAADGSLSVGATILIPGAAPPPPPPVPPSGIAAAGAAPPRAPAPAPVPASSITGTICSFGWNCAQAIAVARCESGLNPWAQNAGNYGLFQINSVHARKFTNFWNSWMDPYGNSQMAYQIWSVQGWSPWACKP